MVNIRDLPVAADGHVEYGDADVALGNEILRTVVGSGVHGMAIEGLDDQDEMGVFIEPSDYVLGLKRLPDGKTFDHYVWRTQPEGARSGPGDVDLTVYSLRKYLRLACRGNPTILLPLFAPEDAILVDTGLGRELRDLAPSIVSLQCGYRFLGYLREQRRRMLGEGKQNRVPNRPELVEQYGYDVKYASHALRLGLQGVEIMLTGSLSLPMATGAQRMCRAVKQGEWSQDRAVKKISEIEYALEGLLDANPADLPEWPDVDRVSAWMVHAHETHWHRPVVTTRSLDVSGASTRG